jgi:hypothetical protein
MAVQTNRLARLKGLEKSFAPHILAISVSLLILLSNRKTHAMEVASILRHPIAQ